MSTRMKLDEIRRARGYSQEYWQINWGVIEILMQKWKKNLKILLWKKHIN